MDFENLKTELDKMGAAQRMEVAISTLTGVLIYRGTSMEPAQYSDTINAMLNAYRIAAVRDFMEKVLFDGRPAVEAVHRFGGAAQDLARGYVIVCEALAKVGPQATNLCTAALDTVTFKKEASQ